ncbi:MAG TPA: ISL3 family transposase [Roseomonas sp.]
MLPGPAVVRLETWGTEHAPPTITLTLTSRSRPAPCPLCSRRARQTHSWYERALADLPWGEHAVAVQLRVRKLFCDNAGCKRRIFTEPLPGVAAPWARKTARLSERLTAVGLALGGAAGARLSRSMGLATSRNTLLRLVRRAPMPPDATPAALGVDDCALRKRHTYGTVLVDLDRHRPVALLPDREADTLATWLREHPGVEVIFRDRASAYAAGGRTGAPDAVQVADRFHLLQNLAEALELAFTGHSRELRDAEQARRQDAVAEGGPVRPDPPPPPKRPLAMAAARREQRMATYQQVWNLHHQGWPGENIARHLGIGRTTTYRHLKSEAFPERKGRSDAGRSSMDPWRDWIIERWSRGQRNGRQMLRDLRGKGFTGNYATVLRYLNRLRDAQQGAAPHRSRARPALPMVAAPKQVLTPRTAAGTVLRPSDRRGDEERALLAKLREAAPTLAAAVALAEEFAVLVRGHKPERLDPWLQRAQDSAVPALQRFAKRLSSDYDAVRAAVTLAWSNGQVEEQINRLKTIKR